eukprot:TRINITY_DN909_c2_g1_i2.p1 TRINITY_DN909_c2_g1~~TRINITY_DN909_c2_g1_i2.p1  ORF type:complete len:250 (+),score=40.82 TRINITY_DN909_c2_g1_i2:83-832(+)
MTRPPSVASSSFSLRFASISKSFCSSKALLCSPHCLSLCMTLLCMISFLFLITTATDGPTTATYLLAPILLFKLAQELLIKPWSGMRKRKEIMQRRVMHRDKQWGEHRRALDEQKLLEIEAKRRLNEELATEGGLVIQNAKYGCLHPNFTYDEEDLPPNVLDVSVCLQAKVANHGLILPAGPKHQYDGFCNVDPHGEEEKYIKVRYLFHDQPHEVEVLENMELALPLLEHKIDLKSAAHEAVSPKNTSR